MALVVDHALKIIAANEQAEHAMKAEDLISARSGRLHIIDGETAAWFKAAFADLRRIAQSMITGVLASIGVDIFK